MSCHLNVNSFSFSYINLAVNNILQDLILAMVAKLNLTVMYND